jgi:hypothetical protein
MKSLFYSALLSVLVVALVVLAIVSARLPWA